MEKKSKALIYILLILTTISIYLLYKRSFIDKDFIVENGEVVDILI